MYALVIILCGIGSAKPGVIDGCSLVHGKNPYSYVWECERSAEMYRQAVKYGDIYIPKGVYIHGHLCVDIPMES